MVVAFEILLATLVVFIRMVVVVLGEMVAVAAVMIIVVETVAVL